MVTYQHFIESAKALSASGSSEMDYRNAASRSYYAAYHICRELAKNLPNFIDIKIRGGVHQNLLNILQGSRDINIRRIGILLQFCKASRTKADYHINDNFDNKEADSLIKNTEKIIELYLNLKITK